MNDYKIYYRRNLPHYQPADGSAFFVTIRLVGTLPKYVVERIKNDYEKSLKYLEGFKSQKRKRARFEALSSRTFLKYEKILDSLKFGRNWLGDTQVSEIVRAAIHYRDQKEYNLIAYTIMPNHVHLVFIPIIQSESIIERPVWSHKLDVQHCGDKDINQPINHGRRNSLPYIVTKIMSSFKWFTALKANEVLKRDGQFWQHESYDHVVRDQNELYRIVNYILNNPVKAKLCSDPSNWECSYFNPDYFV